MENNIHNLKTKTVPASLLFGKLSYFFLVLTLLMAGCKNDNKKNNADFQASKKPQKPVKKTTYYFIRHAEKDLSKASDPNPHLTDLGLKRAAFWADFFKDKSLDAVYSTNYTRAIQTVIPTLAKTKLELQFYDPNRLYSDQFLEETYGKNVLIVGHQISIPTLINKILGENNYQKIPPEVYGNLYTVIIKKDGSKSSSMENFEDFGEERPVL